MNNKRAILVFTRAARREKKRFGFSQASDRRLAHFLVQRTIECAKACSDVADVVVIDDTQQRGVSFGERIESAVSDVKAMGYERVVLIGTDTPELTEADLRLAVENSESVVGPSMDGGFYLFGFDTSDANVLHGLPWQSDTLLTVLTRRLSSPIRLKYRRDLDDAIDVAKTSALRELFFETTGCIFDASPLPTPLTADLPSQIALSCHLSRGPPGMTP